jgi:hypothetical protein
MQWHHLRQDHTPCQNESGLVINTDAANLFLVKRLWPYYPGASESRSVSQDAKPSTTPLALLDFLKYSLAKALPPLSSAAIEQPEDRHVLFEFL